MVSTSAATYINPAGAGSKNVKNGVSFSRIARSSGVIPRALQNTRSTNAELPPVISFSSGKSIVKMTFDTGSTMNSLHTTLKMSRRSRARIGSI